MRVKLADSNEVKITDRGVGEVWAFVMNHYLPFKAAIPAPSDFEKWALKCGQIKSENSGAYLRFDIDPPYSVHDMPVSLVLGEEDFEVIIE